MSRYAILRNFLLGISLLLLHPLSTFAQPKYRINIYDINRTLYKNFLGIPKTVDYVLLWRVSEFKKGKYVETDYHKLFDFEVLYTEGDSTFREAKTIRLGQIDSCVISKLKVGKRYFFKVQAKDSSLIAYQSQVTWMRSGRPSELSAMVEEEKGEGIWLWYLPISGRFPLTFLGYGQVFDKSTILGKLAFHVIWWFFIFGMFILITCFIHLRLSRIFPFSAITLRSKISPLNYEAEFQLRKDEKFFGQEGIIHRWKNVIESVDKLFDKPPKMEGAKSLDFEQLRIQSATWWRDVGRIEIKKLQEDIHQYENYPTARIIRAGLANHETNGFKFMAASEEVDRAIENRAIMELEQLKGKTKIEWLWNLAATAPLIGLFGTVTGISVAFKKLGIQSQRGIIDTATKISELAGGINEALWTTIFGLIVGIFLVLFYYLFKNKLDWIYAKWEEIYVDVSEKL